MDRSKSPSIRKLIRQGLFLQITLSLLILVAVVVVIVFRLQIVGEQERGTRAIGELRSATVALLGTVAAIDRYALLGEAADQTATEQSAAELRRLIVDAGRWLDESGKQRTQSTAEAVDTWKTTVLEPVIADVQSGDKAAAQSKLLSTKNDESIGSIGLPISVIMDERVKMQLRSEQRSRDLLLISASIILLALLALIVAAVSFLLPLRNRVVRPLEDIARASKSIGEGDFSARVERQGVRETELAATAFNQMADIVEHHIDEYEHLDDLKDQFVAAASHELRTPITSIRGYVEMHLDGEVGEISGEQRNNLEVIQRNATQLSELIDDLLTLSSVRQQGRVSLRMQEFNLAEVLAEVAAELRPLAEESRIHIAKHCDGDMVVNGDPTRVRRIFLNLVSNAVKFSDAGGKVQIDARREGDNVIVRVVDQGIGIDRADLPRLGQRFFRAQTARETYGTGLGLSIANELIALHGGEIDVQSEVGKGTQITVVLPVTGPRQKVAGPPAN